MSSPEFIEKIKPGIKEKEYVKTVSIGLNPQDVSKESITLEVDFFQNDDPKNSIYTNIHINSRKYDVHSATQSFWNVSLETFQKAFTHMEEVAYLLGRGSNSRNQCRKKTKKDSLTGDKVA